MPKNLGSINFDEFKEIITQQIMDVVKDLSDDEKEKLISRWEQKNIEWKDEIWCSHHDSAGNAILSRYRGDDVNIILPDAIDGEPYVISRTTFRKKNIESITISKGVKLIERMAFHNCDKLHTVMFSEGFSGTIQDSAFGSCNSIKEFAFPTGIEILSFAVITRCQYLETVHIPDSVKEICAYALAENENLKNIYFNGTKLQWKSIKKARFWNYGIGDFTVYCLDGKLVTRKKVRKALSLKKESICTVDQDVVLEKENNEYIYCEVMFEGTARKYSYITNDESIQVDDIVVVPTGSTNLESLGVVCDIKRCSAKNAPYPPSKTKKILRKYIQE